MKITKIVPSEKVRGRYYVNLEDGSDFAIDLNIIADFGLYTGKELSESEVRELKKTAASAELRAKALRMTSRRAMSKKEVVDRLSQKGAEIGDAEAAAEWLEHLGAVNDEEYAGMIVRHYTLKGYGERRIRDELYRRGVPKECWDEALKELTGTEDTLDKLVSTKLRGGIKDEKDVKKLTASLQRRGFSWSDIRSALERYSVSIEDIEDDI